ncbi:DUF6069 family protein [Actinomadura montaniterrae]|uniref:DUF6069 family protein n=1 Tax=Actinomadura montaniterrae TaxID=1803903 RepID=UPI001CEFAEBE|nr:DUF6069 family protein [Actinomadura montaniterrae]
MASSPLVARVRGRQGAGRNALKAHDVRHHHPAAVAAVVTAAIAAAGKAAGIGLAVGGAPIPVAGFATLTVIFSVVGLVLALVLAPRARRPRTVFVRTTLVLTALSLVPDVLMLTHLAAAAMVIPAIARRRAA